MEISGLLSPLAACAYLATSGFALIAAFRAPARRRDLALFNWFAVVVIFVLLAVWRLDSGEALVQDQVRDWTRARGLYDDRHTFQVPVTLAAVLAITGLIWLAGRASGAANSGKGLSVALIMAVFTAVRATSLHVVDALLYQSVGPIHVNYLIDLGLTAVVAALAVADSRLLGAPAPPPRRSSSRPGSSGNGSRRRRSSSRDHDRR